MTTEEKIAACAVRITTWLHGFIKTIDHELLEKEIIKNIPLWLNNNSALIKKSDFEDIVESLSSSIYSLPEVSFEIQLSRKELVCVHCKNIKPVCILEEESAYNILSLRKKQNKTAA